MLVILFLILLDQASKGLFLKFYPHLIIYNQGIAFGFFSTKWWVGVNFILLILFFLKLRHYQEAKLIIAGGLANVLDRIFYGQVIDFINLKIWPVFNLADLYICLGSLFLLLKIAKKNYF